MKSKTSASPRSRLRSILLNAQRVREELNEVDLDREAAQDCLTELVRIRTELHLLEARCNAAAMREYP